MENNNSYKLNLAMEKTERLFQLSVINAYEYGQLNRYFISKYSSTKLSRMFKKDYNPSSDKLKNIICTVNKEIIKGD
ncbi:hypothetical protein CIL05_07185 [Virgibacillus profundi]|uniref:Uncharacterized protein n=1 Tax=Virgibacillus profundi TaxID=2024555 RepID=A0A2A2IG73_9BACI|nr:hypothetical protein CIL05_07185 [Virgibacillus profundi]PXY54416.1 hypothetical protein CIT14_07270 [Virgibacillus profundi]